LSSALAELQVAADLDPLDYRILYQLGRLKVTPHPPHQRMERKNTAIIFHNETYDMKNKSRK
jgi:hypothetical protein